MYIFCCVKIQGESGDVTITNDGATILKQMQVIHPVARMVQLLLIIIMCIFVVAPVLLLLLLIFLLLSCFALVS